MPRNHTDLLTLYNNIAFLCNRLDQSEKTIDIYMYSLEIRHRPETWLKSSIEILYPLCLLFFVSISIVRS
ncbi:unnamed protein product [Rotaria sordida]|uniref:Uncharacterized protein n=1 Tax=Rotaria sordida TaxID=392033 RepID=A0A815VJ49_9BILA|nr:unnamed protein product [Rotaria sordida]CAF1282649.1 unnamed protein product [Rotaria sordida]CAF1532987.1 unnamed protein product [Rotaria sordida]